MKYADSSIAPPPQFWGARAGTRVEVGPSIAARSGSSPASDFPAPQNWGGGALSIFLCLLALLPLAVQVKAADPVPVAPRIQSQAFKLGYTFRVADLRTVAYTRSVQELKNVTDPLVAGAEVAHFSEAVPALRHAQAASYSQAAMLLNQMGAPARLRLWAQQSAAILNAPLVYPKDAQKMAKTEPATAAVLAELAEIQTLKAGADVQQTPMTLWLEITGGKVTPWTADVGAYTAELRQASHTTAPSPLPGITARVLLQQAPANAPAEARESLATLLPSGGGNLQNLATIAPANITADKITHVYETLLLFYSAEEQAETLDKSAV